MQHNINTCRATGKGPIRHNVDPEKFPYATPAAIQQAQEAAEALADELNEKAGEIIASAKVHMQLETRFWTVHSVCTLSTRISLTSLPIASADQC